MQTVILYGIKNCSTVKKAMQKLHDLAIAYQFFDYKKQPIDQDTIHQWLQQHDINVILNKKGTTWRNLTDEQKQLANDDLPSAIELMMSQPSMIKRPILVVHDKVLVGFDEHLYQQIFCKD